MHLTAPQVTIAAASDKVVFAEAHRNGSPRAICARRNSRAAWRSCCCATRSCSASVW